MPASARGPGRTGESARVLDSWRIAFGGMLGTFSWREPQALEDAAHSHH
jgi:hypothetical protein